MRRWSLRWIAPLLALALAGCGGSGSGPTVARVRFVNGLIGGPAAGLDVRTSTPTGNLNQLGPLLPGAAQPATGSYLTIPELINNNLTLTAYQTGTSTVVASATVNLTVSGTVDNVAGTQTVIVAGVVGATGLQAPNFAHADDAPPSGISADTTEVKLGNFVPDSVSVGLYGAAGQLVPPVSYFGGTPYQAFPASQSGTLVVRDVGSSSASPTTLMSVSGLNGGHAYTLIVIGQESPTAGGEAVKVIVLQDN